MRWYLSHGGHGAAAIDALARFAAAAVIGQECHQIVHRVELRAIDHDRPSWRGTIKLAWLSSFKWNDRVSSFDQNPERQLDNVQVDKQFIDKASGKDTLRPQLDALLSFAREGDTVAVHSMDRLARNLDDLQRLVQQLTKSR